MFSLQECKYPLCVSACLNHTCNCQLKHSIGNYNQSNERPLIYFFCASFNTIINDIVLELRFKYYNGHIGWEQRDRAPFEESMGNTGSGTAGKRIIYGMSYIEQCEITGKMILTLFKDIVMKSNNWTFRKMGSSQSWVQTILYEKPWPWRTRKFLISVADGLPKTTKSMSFWHMFKRNPNSCHSISVGNQRIPLL